MSVYDLIAEQDEAKAHEYTFCLWPRLWQQYAKDYGYTFNWQERKFLTSEADNVPDEPGLYTFVIKPSVANHPSNSYLMYVGKTKRTLRQRFKEYLKEMQRESGRPKIVRLLNKYSANMVFCFSSLQENATTLAEMEKALLSALIPPCNKEQLLAKVRRIVEALR